MDNFFVIRIIPPKVGACPLCGVRHGKDMPHERDSLTYQYRFRKENGRFPTWQDAARHCTPKVKEELRERLNRRGVDYGVA